MSDWDLIRIGLIRDASRLGDPPEPLAYSQWKAKVYQYVSIYFPGHINSTNPTGPVLSSPELRDIDDAFWQGEHMDVSYPAINRAKGRDEAVRRMGRYPLPL